MARHRPVGILHLRTEVEKRPAMCSRPRLVEIEWLVRSLPSRHSDYGAARLCGHVPRAIRRALLPLLLPSPPRAGETDFPVMVMGCLCRG